MLERSSSELDLSRVYNSGYLRSLYGYLEIAYGRKTIEDVVFKGAEWDRRLGGVCSCLFLGDCEGHEETGPQKNDGGFYGKVSKPGQEGGLF